MWEPEFGGGMWRCLVVLLMLRPAALEAHAIFLNSFWMEYTETEAVARVQVSVKEICTAGDLPFSVHEPAERAAIEMAAGKHVPYLLGHLSVSIDGTEVAGELVDITPPVTWELQAADLTSGQGVNAEETVDRLHFIYRLRYPCAKPPSRITLSQTMMSEFAYTPGTPFNFSYLVRMTRKGVAAQDFGNLAGGGLFDIATEFAAGQPAGGVALPETRTGWTRAREFVSTGIHHVLTGYDHLLFAAALVLALRSFWEVFKIVGVFTIAHSITVTLSAYQLVHVSERIVEPLIAGSIVWVACENIFWPQAARGWRRVGWTFFFGLVHGLGLAGVLVEHLEGFSAGLIAVTVLAFCIGVELGHLCIVAPMSLLMAAGREAQGNTFSAHALRYGSAVVAVGGFYFLLNALQWLPENLTPEVLFHMT